MEKVTAQELINELNDRKFEAECRGDFAAMALYGNLRSVVEEIDGKADARVMALIHSVMTYADQVQQ